VFLKSRIETKRLKNIENMRIKYRVYSSRPDDPPRVYSEPVFEGATVEVCDGQAKAELKSIVQQKSNEWDEFSMERIDVEEAVTHIASSIPVRFMKVAGIDLSAE